MKQVQTRSEPYLVIRKTFKIFFRAPGESFNKRFGMTSCNTEQEGSILSLGFRIQSIVMRRQSGRNSLWLWQQGHGLFVHILIDQERGEMLALELAFSFACFYSVQDLTPQDGSTQSQENLPCPLRKSLPRHTERCASLISKGLIRPTRLIIEVSHHTLGLSVYPGCSSLLTSALRPSVLGEQM